MGDDNGGVFLFMLIVGMLFLGAVVGSCQTQKGIYQNAAKHGAGEYYIDQNLEKQWRWLPK